MCVWVWYSIRSSVVVVTEDKQKMAKKRGVAQRQQQPQHCSDPKEHSTDARHGKDGHPKHKKSTKKHKEHAKTGKVPDPGALCIG